MPRNTAVYGVLCDTGFLIRLNKTDDPLHLSARQYFKFLAEGGHRMFVSTIALAEYAVKDRIEHLPMKYFRVVPFNIDHAQRAAEFMAAIISARKHSLADMAPRAIIPNDTKMFAQADVTEAVTHFLTADDACEKIYGLVKVVHKPRFQIISLRVPPHKTFGYLDLNE
jgi:predicted nucleic acid-binding protein